MLCVFSQLLKIQINMYKPSLYEKNEIFCSIFIVHRDRQRTITIWKLVTLQTVFNPTDASSKEMVGYVMFCVATYATTKKTY